MEKITLFSLTFSAGTRKETIEKVAEEGKRKPVRVGWIYAYCAVIAKKDPTYRKAISSFEFLFNDGAGMELAGKILGTPFPENLCGTDWIPSFFRYLNTNDPGKKIFLLGSRKGVVTKAGDLFSTLYPSLKVVGVQDGYYRDEKPILQTLKEKKPEILLVTLGVPRQEIFLSQNWDFLVETGVRIGIAGGAVLDFLTGFLPRAPEWLRKARGEWLYRWIQEPKRLTRRYFVGNIEFLSYLAEEWWRKRKGKIPLPFF